MSLKTKFFAGIFAVSAFAVVGYAQDAKVEGKTGDAKIERRADRVGGRGLHGLFGGQMGGLGRHGLLGIDLTEQQKAQIKEILIASKPDQAVLLEAKTILRAKFEGTATPQQEARLQELKTQHIARAKDVKSQLLAVLTAEQKAQLEQRKQEMKAKMQEFKQKMQERRELRQKKTTATEPTKTN